MTLSIALLAEGDPETRNCWSGSAQALVHALRRRGVEVDGYDVEPAGLSRWMAAARSFSADRATWRGRYRYGPSTFVAKSALAAAALRRAPRRYDAVVQIGAGFEVEARLLRGATSVIYSDSNLRYALRGRPFSGVTELDAAEAERAVSREHRVYDRADRIWTMSRSLADSFRDDFGQPSQKSLVIYAGSNSVPAIGVTPVRESAGPPSILFVGKDHRRKGSEILLQAFAMAREVVPDAELHIVGAIPEGASGPGVIAHGFIAGSTPEGQARMRELFARATVFCLPSRYEPFGIAFVEAMLMGLPCVGVARWAMPEIIEEGVTGWLAADGDVCGLRDILIAALRDPVRSAAMGAAGRERALRLFTWDRVAYRAAADLEELRANSMQRKAAVAL